MSERFWSKIKIGEPDDCWIWHGAHGPHGYGNCYYEGKYWRAHRLAYSLERGPIPVGLLVLHTCDVPLCCNPRHLSVGTQQENASQMVERGRSLTGDKNPSRTKPQCVVRGEKHGRRKLSEAAVRDILTRYKFRKVTAVMLGNEYGVDRTTVLQIVRGEKWKHISSTGVNS